MIRTLYAHARERGVKKLTLATTTYQRAALEMYKRLGWVEVKRIALGVPFVWDLHLYTLELNL